MDFLKLIRSFEELLFEVMTWFVYYPRTLWLTVRHPLRMIDYSNHEQKEGEDQQYADTLSPPLLLLITLVFVHVVELSMGIETIRAGSDAAKAFVSSDQNLIVLRSFMFGLLPLFASLAYVRRRRLPLERKNLRPPFFGQCYLASIYALMISLSYIVGSQRFFSASQTGDVLAAAATLWYLVVQTLQFKRALTLSSVRAALVAIWVFLEAVFYVMIVGLIITGGIAA